MRLRRDDGQLMMLAGIVITLSFILTALTLSQVSSLEREAAADGPSPLPVEWRFLHSRLASNIRTAVTPEMSADSLKNDTFPTVMATFRNIEAEKGYDTIMRLANVTSHYGRSEADLVSGGYYVAWTDDGAREFVAADVPGRTNDLVVANDTKNDGILVATTCPDTSYAGGCIVGVFVYVKLTDGVNSMEETMLFGTNFG